MKKLRYLLMFAVIIMLCFSLSACGNTADNEDPANSEIPENLEPEVTLATTTSTYDSGLLDYLLPIFEEKYGVKVNVLSLGTGQAIATAEAGDADVILVHARAKEDKFVADGFGIERQDVMYNQFIIVGPEADPAGIKDAADLNAAMAAIANSGTEFVSRGDDSGTNTKELALWKAAAIEPAGAWYVEAGQGMADTLQMASEKQAYTLTDEATFLALQKNYTLTVLRQGDDNLLNPYGVILVNPEKYPNLHINSARAFANWLTSEEGQNLIGEFGKDEYGKALFTPSANK
ncbi:MAG: extracellular solute-binding protein [Clostridia bacterium]|nr:extracellular solute-binding protein [Clostridia bacterium]